MTEFIIQRKKSQAQYFTEDLGSDIGLDMILIQDGMFLMGSPPDELERFDSESPQHFLTVPTFFMGRYPITQVQWRFVASLPQVNRELNPDPSRFKGDNRPVESVNWYDAVEFCDRLSQHTNRTYRLPTEAQWEYACRAGATTPFYFGETITTELANYNAITTYGDGLEGEWRQETTPVDHFGIANPFGLCDIHGNVWEWCLDHWHGNYEDAPDDASAWLTDDEEASRVLRGGSWSSDPNYCRSASRLNGYPDNVSSSFGFRVVCELPEFSELVARTNVELKRLGWTNQQGRDYLVKTYGKRSRQLLTDAELLDFLHHLESEPSPQDQVSSTPLAESPVTSYTQKELETDTNEISSTASAIDFSEIVARTNVELKRLGWTNQKTRDYLLQTYGKRSRQLLTDAELLDFLHHLESEPSP